MSKNSNIKDTLIIHHLDGSKQILKPDMDQFDQNWKSLADAVTHSNSNNRNYIKFEIE